MLAEPLAFAYAGWIGGTFLIVFYGLITCYTYVPHRFPGDLFMDTELIPNSAKILAHLMIDDPQLRTYADIGNKAFGHRSRFFVSSLFCLELFAVGYV